MHCMIISQSYSHRGALELLDGSLEWDEIKNCIDNVKLSNHKVKISKEKNKDGAILISPSSVNESLSEQLSYHGWIKKRRTFWMTDDVEVLREGLLLPEEEQKRLWGSERHHSYMEVDFWKNNISMEVQFGKYAFIFHDFLKMKIFYDMGLLDCGIELVPTRIMKQEMSNGPCYFEQAQLYLLHLEKTLEFPIMLIGVEEDLTKN